jgi:hypothetical protein
VLCPGVCCPQAFCNKYFGARNAMIFGPQQLRDFGGELQLDSEPRFADLAGETGFGTWG